MKHTFIFALAIALFATSCSGNGNSKTNTTAHTDTVTVMPPMPIPTRQGWNQELPALNGDVEQVIVTQYFVGTTSLEMKDIYKFNLRGDVVEKIEYDGNTPWNTCRYTYDTEGKMTEEAWFKSDNSLDWRALYTYHSDKGFIDEKSLNSNGEVRSISLRRYNTDWKVADEANYDSEGVLQSTIFYQYDSNGNLTEEAGYFGNGVMEYKYRFERDTNGRIIEMKECDIDNRPIRHIAYSYNSQGRLSEEIVHDDNGVESKWLYRYDTRGNVVKIEPTEKRNIVTEFRIKYRK